MKWTEKQSNTWYSQQPWLVGCNFLPSSAINQLEMFQEDTFDQKTIERELDWVRQGAKGRQTKQKARLSNYDKLLNQDQKQLDAKLEIYIPIPLVL